MAEQRAGQRMTETEERWSAACASLLSPVFLTSTDGRIIDLNRAATNFFGARAGLIDRPIQELLPMLVAAEMPQSSWRGPATNSHDMSTDFDVVCSRIESGRPGGSYLYILHSVSKLVEENQLHEQLLYREQLLYNTAQQLGRSDEAPGGLIEMAATDCASLPHERASSLTRDSLYQEAGEDRLPRPRRSSETLNNQPVY